MACIRNKRKKTACLLDTLSLLGRRNITFMRTWGCFGYALSPRRRNSILMRTWWHRCVSGLLGDGTVHSCVLGGIALDEESHNTHHWLTSEVFSSGLVLGCARVACRVKGVSAPLVVSLSKSQRERFVRLTKRLAGGERLRSVVPGRGFVRPNCHGSPTLWPLQARRARGRRI